MHTLTQLRVRIPLAYVIREDEAPPPNQVYQSEHHRLISITPLLGIEFEEDNGKVFDLLKSWTLNGPAWTWMRAYNATRNGRQAWIALIAHFEGDAQRDRVKDHAYAAISSARYFGDRKKFSFETYVTIHQESYSDLEQYGEIISEEKRVRDLLTGIKDNSPATSAAKGTILATPNLWNSFSNAVTHLSTTLQLSQSLQDPQNISAFILQADSKVVEAEAGILMDADAAAAVDKEEEEGETYTLGHTLQTNGASYRQKIRNAL